ncbi:unnamed protein product [Amoebophrya sp. A25]|nr:unnamed protein product [Amoebophrya sp. A25]|eukprot:GSA25T00020017001.1
MENLSEMNPRTAAALLEVSGTATKDEIAAAFKRLALKFHPDKNRDHVECTTAAFQLVQAARTVLLEAAPPFYLPEDSPYEEEKAKAARRGSLIKNNRRAANHAGSTRAGRQHVDDVQGIGAFFTSSMNGRGRTRRTRRASSRHQSQCVVTEASSETASTTPRSRNADDRASGQRRSTSHRGVNEDATWQALVEEANGRQKWLQNRTPLVTPRGEVTGTTEKNKHDTPRADHEDEITDDQEDQGIASSSAEVSIIPCTKLSSTRKRTSSSENQDRESTTREDVLEQSQRQNQCNREQHLVDHEATFPTRSPSSSSAATSSSNSFRGRAGGGSSSSFRGTWRCKECGKECLTLHDASICQVCGNPLRLHTGPGHSLCLHGQYCARFELRIRSSYCPCGHSADKHECVFASSLFVKNNTGAGGYDCTIPASTAPPRTAGGGTSSRGTGTPRSFSLAGERSASGCQASSAASRRTSPEGVTGFYSASNVGEDVDEREHHRLPAGNSIQRPQQSLLSRGLTLLTEGDSTTTWRSSGLARSERSTVNNNKRKNHLNPPTPRPTSMHERRETEELTHQKEKELQQGTTRKKKVVQGQYQAKLHTLMSKYNMNPS